MNAGQPFRSYASHPETGLPSSFTQIYELSPPLIRSKVYLLLASVSDGFIHYLSCVNTSRHPCRESSIYPAAGLPSTSTVFPSYKVADDVDRPPIVTHQMARLPPVSLQSIGAVRFFLTSQAASEYPASATYSHLCNGSHQIYDAWGTMVPGRYIWYALGTLLSTRKLFMLTDFPRLYCVISQETRDIPNIPPSPIPSICTSETFLSVLAYQNISSRSWH